MLLRDKLKGITTCKVNWFKEVLFLRKKDYSNNLALKPLSNMNCVIQRACPKSIQVCIDVKCNVDNKRMVCPVKP